MYECVKTRALCSYPILRQLQFRASLPSWWVSLTLLSGWAQNCLLTLGPEMTSRLDLSKYAALGLPLGTPTCFFSTQRELPKDNS